MVMTKVFDKLKNLQEILVNKYEIEQKIDEAPKQLNTQQELLERLKKDFIKKSSEYDEVKSTVNQLQEELEGAIKSRESGEKGMDNITTHREYEALERQISEASLKEQDIRKHLQKEEKNLDELTETLKQIENMINAQESDLNTSKEMLNKEINIYKTELAALQKKENKIAPDLDKETLFKFQRIIQRNTEGIVAVKNGVCQGCRMILPAQFANEVHKNEEILFCPYCSRILYYEEATEDEQESFFKLDDTGSLANLDDDDFEDEEEDDVYEKDEIFSDDENFDSDEIDEDEELDDEEEEDPQD